MKPQDVNVDQLKRLLAFKLKQAEEDERKLQGQLATARGHVGRIERLLRENATEQHETRRILAEAERDTARSKGKVGT